MKKSEFKRATGKEISIRDRLYHKGIFCISPKWCKWAKGYLSCNQRRKNKQNIKHIN